MTTDTATLTDFLLARIAEDEAGARGELEMDPQSRLGAQWLDLMRRVLAECEAKRRIVDLFPSGPDGDGWDEAGWRVMGIIAAVYADHPDFRDEWR